MLSKRTIIGLIVGSVIIGIGGLSLIQHLQTITINEDYLVEVGDSVLYTIPAPAHTPQFLNVTGNSFDITLESPSSGLQIPTASHKDNVTLDWTHIEDGETKIKIQNTGNNELQVEGILIRSSDPIWFTFDLMVIISGIVIIGFSMGFTMRKPKGF